MSTGDSITLTPVGRLRGELAPPPDKSISHRALIFASLAGGTSHLKNLLKAEDPMRTVRALQALGIELDEGADRMTVRGKGLYGFKEPSDIIDCGNSGTTMRLLAGLLAGQPFFSVLTGDASLRTRPMERVITPLSLMGARITGRQDNTRPPLAIRGGTLSGIHYESPVASAQVKSAVLIAGLYTEGACSIVEPHRSRDHTERMLPFLGADVRVDGLTVSLAGGRDLTPVEMTVPGDFSSAAFFIAAAALVPGSEVLLRNVGINPTRSGFLRIARQMGADLELMDEREVSGEPVADIVCRSSAGLRGISIGPEDVPALIDEFPVLTVLATQAEGRTTIAGAAELRVKESDRIAAMATELGKMGAAIEEHPDGLSIDGPVRLTGSALESHGDHRVAMALTVASLIAAGETTIRGVSSVDVSFPGFHADLGKLAATR